MPYGREETGDGRHPLVSVEYSHATQRWCVMRGRAAVLTFPMNERWRADGAARRILDHDISGAELPEGFYEQ